MAIDKKSFVLYSDLIHTVSKLPNDKAGELFKHILSYVNDENPKTDDLIINISFEPIKQQLKRDLKKYEEIKSKRSEAGKESARLRALNKYQQNPTSVESVKQCSTLSTVNDNVNVNVNDNVNDINKRESALDFLNSNAQSRFEAFTMQNKANVNDWQMMLDSYNDQIDLEIAQNKISFNVDELFPRLSKWCRAWISNQKPKETKPTTMQEYEQSLRSKIKF